MSAESDHPEDAQSATQAADAEPDTDADADADAAAEPDTAAERDAPGAQHAQVLNAVAAFERGDFWATRRLLDELDALDPAPELTEADRKEIARLRHGIGRDRVTLSTGITAAAVIAAIILYYVVM